MKTEKKKGGKNYIFRLEDGELKPTTIWEAAKSLSEKKSKDTRKQTKTMKTLPECKDKIAKKEGYRNWSVMEASSSVSYTCLLECLEAAAELYASQFREPSSPAVKESETGEQEEIMKALEEARCLDPESPNWSYHAASRIALEAIKKTRKPLDR